MKKSFIVVSAITILLSCNSKTDSDPNGPKANAIKMLNDECQQKTRGVIKVTGISNYDPETGNINGLNYYYVSGCTVEFEVTRDSSYLGCFLPKGSDEMEIFDFNFKDSPGPDQKVYNNLNTRVTGIETYSLLKKGKHFFGYSSMFDSFTDTTLSTYLIFVKRSGGWVQAEESEKHLVINTLHPPIKNK